MGLKNSDDQGTQFDLRAEVDRNGLPVTAGETLCVTGVTRNPSNALQVLLPFSSFAGAVFNGTSDVLSLRVLARIGTNPDGNKCSGPGGSHNNATGLRLYFDAIARPASFDLTFSVGTDTTPPTISATSNPAPNSSGWNNSDVTVSFSCVDTSSGVAFCSSPVTLSAEGANQTVQGTAQDNAGNAASSSVVVSIDKTAPVVVIASPSSGEALSVPDIVVTGDASDSLSGVATVACNGIAASLSGSNFSCPMTLTAETNPVLVQATDMAGNLASSQIIVTLTGAALPPPQRILLTPSTMSILVDEERDLEVVDEQGRPRSGATWTASPSGILQISTSTGRPVLKGLSAGQATVTANLQGFLADTTVNVIAGTILPPGTVRWSVTPTENFTTAQMIQASPTEEAPDLYTIETGPAGEVLVRAFSADGRQRWQSFASTSGTEYLVKAVSSTTGGLLLQFQGSSFIIYKEPQSGQQLWRYDSPGTISFTGAVHPKGSVYFVETIMGPGNSFAQLIELNESTGTIVSTVPLPNSTTTLTNNDCIPGASQFSSEPPLFGQLMVAPDGSVSLQVTVTTYTQDGIVCGHSTVSSTTSLSLLQVQPGGSSTLQPVQSVGASGTDLADFPTAFPGETIPDGQDGLLAGWTYSASSSFGGGTLEARLSRSSATGVAEYTLPFEAWYELGSMVLGENGVVFATEGSRIFAVNFANGAVNWTWLPPTASVHLVGSLADGGLAVLDSNTQLALLDSMGAVRPESMVLPSITYQSPWSLGDSYGLLSNGYSSLFSGPVLDYSILPWSYVQGNPVKTRSEEPRTISVFIPKDPGDPNSPLGLYTAEDARRDIDQILSGKPLKHLFFIRQKATPEAFQSELKQPRAGVVFVGHSVLILREPPESPSAFSVGLYFHQDRLLARRPDPNIPDLSYNFDPELNPVLVDRLESQVKIAYVASCLIGRAFTDLWGIDTTTPNRALIYTPQQSADLVQSVAGWTFVAEALVSKDSATAQKAVDYANPKLIINAQIAQPPVAPIQLQVLGDGNARIRH